jgi:hypothetical protein
MPGDEEEPGSSPDPWSRVDPKIWAAGHPISRPKRILQQLTSTFGVSSIWALVIIGPLMILLTFAGTYYLVGASFFGPALILVWTGLIAGFILVMEKTGYARNFEASDFKLSKDRLLASFLSFAILVAIFYVVTVVLKKP